jgi:hypothetical protein
MLTLSGQLKTTAWYMIRISNESLPRASILDFVKVATGQRSGGASVIISHLQARKPDFFASMGKYQFPGCNQREQYVLDAPQALKLLMMLPGRCANVFRGKCGGLLTRVFGGDPALHEVVDRYNLTANATQNLCEYFVDASPGIMDALSADGDDGNDGDGDDDTHKMCTEWIAANIDRISFAAEICPTCQVPVAGLSLVGGLAYKAQAIPYTHYRADVLVQLPASHAMVAVEVADTYFTSMKRMFECEEQGVSTYEVETHEIQLAMQRDSCDGCHILRTIRTRSVPCAACLVVGKLLHK